MSQICINVPRLKIHQTINLEVTIDGKKQVMNYKVESFPWTDELDPIERIDVLRSFINDYKDEWDLVQIGPPDDHLIPVMFKQRVTVGHQEPGQL